MPRHTLFLLVLATLLPPPLPCQDSGRKPDPEKSLKKATAALVRVAGKARAARAVDLGQDLLRRVIECYDPDHYAARRMLGYRRSGRNWVIDAKARPWRQGSTSPTRLKRLQDEADRALERVNLALRDAGIADLAAGRQERGRKRLRLVLDLMPGDAAAASALGLKVVNGLPLPKEAAPLAISGVELRRRADQILAAVPPLGKPAKPPAFLSRCKLEFNAVTSKHFRLFTRGDAELAGRLGRLGTATLNLLEHLCPGVIAAAGRRQPVIYVHFWDKEEKDRLVTPLNHLIRNDRQLPDPLGVTSLAWVDGPVEIINQQCPHRFAQVLVMDLVDKFIRPRKSDAIDETFGLLLTDLLLGRIDASLCYGSHARDGRMYSWSPGLYTWNQKVRELAGANRTTSIARLLPLGLVDLERRYQVTLWSFGSYLLRRNPTGLYKALAEPGTFINSYQEARASLEKVFGVPIDRLDAQWRQWLMGPALAAEGLADLPDEPIPAPVAAQVKALNDRRRVHGLSALKAVPAVCRSCRNHARYLACRRKVAPGGLHRQDPADPAYSPDGDNVARYAFVACGVTSLADLVDRALNSLEGRVALMSQDLVGIGMALRDGVGVLDFTSARGPEVIEPIQPFFSSRENVPCTFPRPAGPCTWRAGFDPAKAGYPIVLHLPRHIRFQYGKAEAELTCSGVPVPVILHEPGRPLAPGRPLGGSVIVVPTVHLKPETVYKLRIRVEYTGSNNKRQDYNLVFVTGRK